MGPQCFAESDEDIGVAMSGKGPWWIIDAVPACLACRRGRLHLPLAGPIRGAHVIRQGTVGVASVETPSQHFQ